MSKESEPSAETSIAKRLVCVVEGRGDVAAVPCLCSKIRDHLEAWEWFVDPDPVRWARSRMVDERLPSPRRPAREADLMRAVTLASRRPADAVLVVCDSDDDCPAIWGPDAARVVNGITTGGAVMAVREYEAWLLVSLVASDLHGGREIERIRDAKGSVSRLVAGYSPTVHQLRLTQGLDIQLVWARSDSFDKLVRVLADVFGVAGVTRPLVV